MKFRNAYERGVHDGQSFNEPSLTQQHFKDDCDVNKIIDRYTRTGVVPAELINRSSGVYGDFSDVGDFFDAQQRVANAVQNFESLPSNIRRRFNDDPAQLIAFCNDSKNYEEALKLGLVRKREVVPDPAPVPETPPITDQTKDVKS